MAFGNSGKADFGNKKVAILKKSRNMRLDSVVRFK